MEQTLENQNIDLFSNYCLQIMNEKMCINVRAYCLFIVNLLGTVIP